MRLIIMDSRLRGNDIDNNNQPNQKKHYLSETFTKIGPEKEYIVEDGDILHFRFNV